MYPTRLLHPCDFPGKNTGVSCHFFFQGISQTQGSNPCLSHLGRLFTIWSTRETHHKIDDLSWKRLYTQRQENPSLSHLGILTQNQFSLVAQLCPILCDPMDCSTPGFCPSPIPGAYSNSCPSSWWCHPTISSSVMPFSSHLQSFSASRSFPMSHFFTSGSQILIIKY